MNKEYNKNGEFSGVNVEGSIWDIHNTLMEREKFKNLSKEERLAIRLLFHSAEKTGVLPVNILLEYAMPSSGLPLSEEVGENLGKMLSVKVSDKWKKNEREGSYGS